MAAGGLGVAAAAVVVAAVAAAGSGRPRRRCCVGLGVDASRRLLCRPWRRRVASPTHSWQQAVGRAVGRRCEHRGARPARHVGVRRANLEGGWQGWGGCTGRLGPSRKKENSGWGSSGDQGGGANPNDAQTSPHRRPDDVQTSRNRHPDDCPTAAQRAVSRWHQRAAAAARRARVTAVRCHA